LFPFQPAKCISSGAKQRLIKRKIGMYSAVKYNSARAS